MTKFLWDIKPVKVKEKKPKHHVFVGMGREILTAPLAQITLESEKCRQRFHVVFGKLPCLLDPIDQIRKFPVGTRVAITKTLIGVPIKSEGTHGQDLVLVELPFPQISTSSI